jgi:hypothetical protein
MNINQLLAWLNSHQITVVEKVKTYSGEVYVFVGKRPLPWDGRPQWYALAVKDGQTTVATKEIEALLRHFTHGELQIPKAAPAIGSSIAIQPLHKKPS